MKSILLITLITLTSLHPAGFLNTTIIKTPNGYTPIRELQTHQYAVTALNKKETQVQSITKISCYPSDCYLEITTQDETINCSPDHHFFLPCQNAWCRASELSPGDKLYALNGSPCIERVKAIKAPCMLYDLSIAKTHTYFITKHDILVHNFAVAIPLFSWVMGEGIAFLGSAAATGLSIAFFKDSIKKIVKSAAGSKKVEPPTACTSGDGEQPWPPRNWNGHKGNPHNQYNPDEFSHLTHDERNKLEGILSLNRPLNAPEADFIAVRVLGFERTNSFSRMNKRIYKHPKKSIFISADRKKHNGGIWKQSNSLESINKKTTRTGTYNWNLQKKIGE